MNLNEENGSVKRKGIYSLNEFLYDCKNNRSKIVLAPDALNDSINAFHIVMESKEKVKDQILDQICKHSINDFEYINTRPFRKGINGDHPLVDAYNFSHSYINMYISLCIVKTNNGWYIKSLHPDNSHSGFGDSMSIGDMMKLLGSK